MYYEICITLRGKHFFATSDRSLTTRDQMLKVLDVFLTKFPESEGYSILVFENRTTGRGLSLRTLKRELSLQ